MSALRRAKWPVKYMAVSKVSKGKGKNPATGRVCKLHECEHCHNLFPASDMQADHIDPVVPLDGKWGRTTKWLGVNWNELIPRLYCDLDNFQALCEHDHTEKTKSENEERRKHNEKAK